MSAKPDYVVNTLSRSTGATATGGYVINLTSSTTPMALSQPKDPTLAQYTFFVSRRLEDGRERFRLHMGYFESMQAAEDMLSVVREVYPSAWAGEAPGKKLRANNSASATPAAAPRAAAPAAQPKAAAAVAAAPARAAAPVACSSPGRRGSQARGACRAEERHPFASTPLPAPTPKFEEPFVLSEDDTEFKPLDVPVVHPPTARPVVSPPPSPSRKSPLRIRHRNPLPNRPRSPPPRRRRRRPQHLRLRPRRPPKPARAGQACGAGQARCPETRRAGQAGRHASRPGKTAGDGAEDRRPGQCPRADGLRAQAGRAGCTPPRPPFRRLRRRNRPCRCRRCRPRRR